MTDQTTFVVSLVVSADLAGAITDMLDEATDAAAVASTDQGDGLWHIDAHYLNRPDLDRIERVLGERLRDLGAAPALPELRLQELPDKDWVAASQRALHPVHVGRFFVHGSHDRDRALGHACSIEIDAGQAFGTAHHATTEGCLHALDLLFKRQRFVRMLDLGTGSGILAIAAAKAARRPVLASDVDALAATTARANAARNGVGPWVRVVQARGLAHPRLRRPAAFDLIVANILARPLHALVPELARACTPHGALVLSGITRAQSAPLAARYVAAGFALERRIVTGDWATLVMRARRTV